MKVLSFFIDFKRDRFFFWLMICFLIFQGLGIAAESKKEAVSMEKIKISDDEWKKKLTPEQYRILREKGTEAAFTGEHWDNHRKGTYNCAACDMVIFSSESKFDSGTGWPSFYKPIAPDCIANQGDNSYGMIRTEVECARCGGHQGHVFDDGPPPTGLRYCINSVSLDFVKQ